MPAQPLILVCDHRGEGLAERLGALAAAGHQIEVAANLRQTLARLARLRPDAIVVDPLSTGGGVELDAIERTRPRDPVTPVLVVADDSDPLPAVLGARVLESGMWDLVRRDAPPEEYLLRIELLRARAGSSVEMEELRHRAVHDDRTDLLRPRAFQERLREHFSAAQRHKLDLALLLLDLDRFGEVNKRYDHTIGDLVIAQVGAVVRRTLRAEDVAGRLGGDEFAVLLPYTRKIDAARVTRRLLDEVRGLAAEGRLPLPDLQVTASIGFETFDGADLDSVETLRLHAEDALRTAKRRGGDRGIYHRAPDEGEPAA